MVEKAVRDRIAQKYTQKQLKTQIDFPETIQDVELLVSQNMLAILSKFFTMQKQQEFIELINLYLTNAETAGQRQIGKQLSRDGITYLLAIMCRCIQDNSGYKKPVRAGSVA